MLNVTNTNLFSRCVGQRTVFSCVFQPRVSASCGPMSSFVESCPNFVCWIEHFNLAISYSYINNSHKTPTWPTWHKTGFVFTWTWASQNEVCHAPLKRCIFLYCNLHDRSGSPNWLRNSMTNGLMWRTWWAKLNNCNIAMSITHMAAIYTSPVLCST